ARGRPARPGRPFALLQRLLRGPGDLARARGRGELRALTGRRRRHTRIVKRLTGGALWTLLATLGVLVIVTMPDLGAGGWPFAPPSVHPHGLLGPLVRAADREWDLGILRSTAVLAALCVALAAAASWHFRSWPRWAGVGLVGLVCAML